MLLQELKNQANKLPVSDRIELVRSIIDSIQETTISTTTRSQAIRRMKGLLKTSQPAPTDMEVATTLEQRLMEKYL
jgi:putative addiction module component (TIGR02574 family)